MVGQRGALPDHCLVSSLNLTEALRALILGKDWFAKECE